MKMNNDYFNLCLERIRLINYLNKNLDKDITLSNEDFVQLFIIGEENYENPEMSPIDRAMIETMMNLETIELNKQELRNILDLAVANRVPISMNKLIAYKCLKVYNLNHKNKIGLKNIDTVLDSLN